MNNNNSDHKSAEMLLIKSQIRDNWSNGVNTIVQYWINRQGLASSEFPDCHTTKVVTLSIFNPSYFSSPDRQTSTTGIMHQQCYNDVLLNLPTRHFSGFLNLDCLTFMTTRRKRSISRNCATVISLPTFFGTPFDKSNSFSELTTWQFFPQKFPDHHHAKTSSLHSCLEQQSFCYLWTLVASFFRTSESYPYNRIIDFP